MNNNKEFSRRGFLTSAGALSASAWLRGAAPMLAGIAQAACSARDNDAEFSAMGAADAADFHAIAARIIPTTDTPGATEAGVIHFFDQAFAGDNSDDFEFAVTGLLELNQGERRFAEQSEADQDDALRAIEDSPFFKFMRVMTIYGFFAMSKYGGNKDHIAWDLIGFEDHHGAWSYPFGYYDAEVHGDADNG